MFAGVVLPSSARDSRPLSTQTFASGRLCSSRRACRSSRAGCGTVGSATMLPVGVVVVAPTTTVCPASPALTVFGTHRDELVERQEQVGLLAEPVRARGGAAREAQVADDRAGLLRQPDLVEAAHVIAVEHRGGAEHLRHRHDAGAADPGDAQRELVVGHDERGLGRDRRGVGQALPGPNRPLTVPPTLPPARCGAPASVARRRRASTVMNDGQSPSRHEKSRLQVVWSISVLRPNGVSIGCTERQLLTSPQSPQPSQMRWLITTRWFGVATSPRLRSAPRLAPRSPGRGSAR